MRVADRRTRDLEEPMPDPDAVAIPALAGAALAQGITFLYGQAAELLRVRREDKGAHRVVFAVPEVFKPLDSAARPDLAVLADRERDLRMLLQIAEPFTARPAADLDGADESLRVCFGHIRAVLEDVYGTRFTFGGEPRPTRRVRQTVGDVRGPTTGMKIRGATANTVVDVVQRVKTVHESGELTGIDIDLGARQSAQTPHHDQANESSLGD
ncbi:hypothetical protein ABH935_009176 [Catenulispora sp. GAS73]|uniref:hypothetical protein n=1 Tax=Catenulispora sp. GAS73 TaxID=3156269 RepID=UPI00351857C9